MTSRATERALPTEAALASAGDHATYETREQVVPGAQTSPANGSSRPVSTTPGTLGGVALAPGGQTSQAILVARPRTATPESRGDDQCISETRADIVVTPDPSILLLLAADLLDDAERVRIATENRIRSLAEVKGLAGSPAHARWEAHLGAIRALEAAAALELKRALREHPLGPWVKRTKGVGEKQGARLLAAIGDPYWNDLEDRPRRGPAELWAYCGFAPGQKRQKGVKSNWNAEAKMRAFLIAEKTMTFDGQPDKNGRPRARSPYRADYERARASWAGRDVTDAHAHAHALRVTAKAILRDLFVEARDLREEQA